MYMKIKNKTPLGRKTD